MVSVLGVVGQEAGAAFPLVVTGQPEGRLRKLLAWGVSPARLDLTLTEASVQDLA